ncbi:VOC family protein [Ornithinimicrobium sp. F0845]|nr:VOC family protein [Ornithinimicrobium sp. F0845]
MAPPPDGFESRAAWFAEHAVPEGEWDDGAFLHDPSVRGPTIWFLRVPEAKTVKNRLHLDLQVGGGRQTPWEQRWPRVTGEVARLGRLGAQVVQEVPPGERPDHVIMVDPEGNEFCVV